MHYLGAGLRGDVTNCGGGNAIGARRALQNGQILEENLPQKNNGFLPKSYKP